MIEKVPAPLSGVGQHRQIEIINFTPKSFKRGFIECIDVVGRWNNFHHFIDIRLISIVSTPLNRVREG